MVFEVVFMDSRDNIDYELVEEVLAEAECETTAAELQAILCGVLAAGVKPEDKTWLSAVIDIIKESGEPLVEVQDLIKTLYDWSHFQMYQHDSLAPTLLPDDKYPVIDQLEAIANWCQGFLLGFGLEAGRGNIDSHEVREALTDIAEISQIELEADESEETQVALVTLIEHIKVAVKVIFWEVVMKNTADTPPDQASQDNQTLH